jgi:hypothetical protein
MILVFLYVKKRIKIVKPHPPPSPKEKEPHLNTSKHLQIIRDFKVPLRGI